MARIKGSTNKITTIAKDIISDILENNREDISNEFKRLNSRDKVKLYIELLRLITPRQRIVEATEQKPPLEEIKITIIPPKPE